MGEMLFDDPLGDFSSPLAKEHENFERRLGCLAYIAPVMGKFWEENAELLSFAVINFSKRRKIQLIKYYQSFTRADRELQALVRC
jgi:hypothetical protein